MFKRATSASPVRAHVAIPPPRKDTAVRPIRCESLDPVTRYRVLVTLSQHFDAGVRDPELLYLGARFAVALGMAPMAARFLDALAAIPGEGPSTARVLFPIGLLRLSLLATGPKREALLAELNARAEGSPAHARALACAMTREAEPPAGSPAALLRAAANSHPRTPDATQLAQLAAQAKAAYRERRLGAARFDLEAILLACSDQPDVLWNLLVVTAEQGDVEANGRYWRRYVKLHLMRIMRADAGWAAFEELYRFYGYVAETTDRAFGSTETKFSEKLRTPGLLDRWLEAQMALVWLDGLLDPGGPRTDTRGTARNCQHIMKLWLRAFYPEFLPYFEPGNPLVAGTVRPRLRAPARTLPDPVATLLRRFTEWSRCRFGLMSDEDVPQKSAMHVFAECVALLPWPHHVKDMQKQLQGQDTRVEPFRRAMQDNLTTLLRESFDKLMEADAWQEIADRYGSPQLSHVLTPIRRLYVARAHSKVKAFPAAIAQARAAIVDLTPEDVAEDGPAAALLSIIVAAVIEPLQTKPAAERDRDIAQFKAQLAAPGYPACAAPLVAQLEKDIALLLRRGELDAIWDKAMEAVKAAMKTNDFQKARNAIERVPDDDYLKAIKANYLDQIAEVQQQARRHAELDRMYDQAVETIKSRLRYGDKYGARRAVEQLPNEPYLSKAKASLLDQLNQL